MVAFCWVDMHSDMKPLSPTMKRAIGLARSNNGVLTLDFFGHWYGQIKSVRVTARTVKALVYRGLMEYTEAPTQVTLTEAGRSVEV